MRAILADRAYIGAGAWVTTQARRPAGGDLTLTQQTVNRALSSIVLLAVGIGLTLAPMDGATEWILRWIAAGFVAAG